MHRVESEERIHSEGTAREGDQDDLQYHDDPDDGDEHQIVGDACECIFLHHLMCTSSCILRAFIKLKTCSITKVLNTKVMCRE